MLLQVVESVVIMTGCVIPPLMLDRGFFLIVNSEWPLLSKQFPLVVDCVASWNNLTHW